MTRHEFRKLLSAKNITGELLVNGVKLIIRNDAGGCSSLPVFLKSEEDRIFFLGWHETEPQPRLWDAIGRNNAIYLEKKIKASEIKLIWVRYAGEVEPVKQAA